MDERCAALAVRLLGEALGAWGGCAGAGAAASDESPLLGAAADLPAGAGLAPAGLKPCGAPAVPLADLAGMWAQAHAVLSAVHPMLESRHPELKVGAAYLAGNLSEGRLWRCCEPMLSCECYPMCMICWA